CARRPGRRLVRRGGGESLAGGPVRGQRLPGGSGKDARNAGRGENDRRFLCFAERGGQKNRGFPGGERLAARRDEPCFGLGSRWKSKHGETESRFDEENSGSGSRDGRRRPRRS